MLSSPSRPGTAAPSDGSRTVTLQDVQLPSADAGSSGSSLQHGTMRLRGGPRSNPRVAWDERVIDNENCGRKKSKICCIYHKPKAFDESSDESSSDDDSDSADDGRARPRHPHRHNGDDHSPDHPGGESCARGGGAGGAAHELEDGLESNAYESQPRKGKAA